MTQCYVAISISSWFRFTCKLFCKRSVVLYLVVHLNAEFIPSCCRYENALQKANYASLAMKEEQEQEQAADAEDADELQVVVPLNIFSLAANLIRCSPARSVHAGKHLQSPNMS